MKKLLFLLLIAGSLVSCNKKRASEDTVLSLSCIKLSKPQYAPSATDKEIEKSPNASVNTDTKSYTKKIIKDGEISISVKDINTAKKQTDVLLRKYRGYYENESLTNNENDQFFELKIRIPSPLFEQFIANLDNGTGEITSKSITARDVTDEYIDVETRLQNKKLYLSKYTELLRKANNIKEILDIQERIRVIQEEIESKEGRLKYLNDLVNYSSLNLRLFVDQDKTTKAIKGKSFTARLKTSLTDGWKAFVSALIGLIELWPFIIVFIALFLLFRRYRSRRKNREKNKESAL